MGNLLWRELGLVVLTGLFVMFAVPAMLAKPVATVLFLVGLMMGLAFVGFFAMTVLAGKRMSDRTRGWIGLLSWVGMFAREISLFVALWMGGVRVTPGAVYGQLAPALLPLLLVGGAAIQAPFGERVRVALGTLCAYSFPMLLVRLLLLPLVSGSQVATQIAVHGSAFYLFLRVLMGLVWPVRTKDGNSSRSRM